LAASILRSTSASLRADEDAVGAQPLECLTGINVANAEAALGRKIDFEIINEYRGAISALNSGAPFMASRPDDPLGQSVTAFARQMDAVLVASALATPS